MCLFEENVYTLSLAAARVDHLEVIFIRLLHLLAHHPDFSIAHENLQDMAK